MFLSKIFVRLCMIIYYIVDEMFTEGVLKGHIKDRF